MKCRKCNGELEVKRSCRRVRLQCKSCRHEYQVHEVASDLDEKTSAILEQYTTIIYD
ncbi:MAG: dual CXXC motif small (seleno)protein [Thermodesulfobacteriota bacterium]|jgi:DNA-directed RNA polymerase subunit M/transcription elongation factor TFIIS